MNEIATREEINNWLSTVDLRPVPPGTTQTVYPYLVRFTIYDIDGSLISSNDKRFRYRKIAEKWASNLRTEHTRKGIISSITIIKTSTNAIISHVKSDRLKKIQRDIKKGKVLRTY